MLDTAVALIIFNRPDVTERVFAEIAKAKPRRLFVIADGPRHDRPGESERCAAARAVLDRVDWECEVQKNYSETNLGCARRVATGISWVFQHAEDAIILEDDCVPDPTFFRFCEEMLDRFRDDERVMHVGGGGYQLGRTQRPYSYFFSRHYPCWGWATWRRAWQHYDIGLSLWPALRDTGWLGDIMHDERLSQHWRRLFDLTHAGLENVNTWDFQWTFACWAQHGLSVLPYQTLVSNVGYRADATHTRHTSHPLANLSTDHMAFPLQHPPYVAADSEADRTFADHVIIPDLGRRPSLYRRLRNRFAAAMPGRLRKSISATRTLSFDILRRARVIP